MLKNKEGFTLIELLVVVAIIGLLSTLSILALNSARARARDAKRVADVKQIQTALEMYFNDAGAYPASISTTTGIAYNSTTYLDNVPNPPSVVDGGTAVCASSTATAYTYTFYGTGPASTYSLQYCLGSAVNNVPAGMNTATPAGIK